MLAYDFYSSCVDWPESDVRCEGGLCDMIDKSVSITRRSFLKYVNREQLKQIELDLSYSEHPSQGLTMAGDWHVDYFKSTLHGKRVYGFKHSAIEFVFTQKN